MAGKRKRVYKQYRKKKKAKRMVKAIRRLTTAGLALNGWARSSTNALRVERKYVQFCSQVLVSQVIQATPIILLNGLNVGSGVSERIGRRVNFTSLYWKVTANCRGSNTDGAYPEDVLGRFVIVLDMQSNAVAPKMENVLEDPALDAFPLHKGNFGSSDPDATSQNDSAALAPLNLEYRDRFRILTDKTWKISLNPNNVGTASVVSFSGMIHKEGYKKLNIETTYNAATGNGPDTITTNGIYAFFITTAQPAGTAVSNWKIMTRMRYTDA